MKSVIYFKYKKLIFNLCIYALIIYLIIHSNVLFASITSSTNIFISKLIPALFPYLLITEILINSGKIYNLAFGLESILAKFFHIPKNATSPIIIGFLLGYPNSAKCILKLYKDNVIDSKVSSKLVSFTSNANISYIIATIGIGMFQSIEIGIILAVSHFLSAIIIGIVWVPSYNTSIIHQKKIISNSFNKIYTPFELLYISIMGSLKTLAYIFSYTVIFSLIPTIILSNINLPELIKAIIIGIFEISNGISNISNLDISLNYKLVIISFILSMSSLMILIQIFSFVFKAKVKFIDLLKYKIIQGLISSVITYIIVQFIYSPTIPVFLNQDSFDITKYIFPSTIYMFSVIITLTLSFVIFRKKRQD